MQNELFDLFDASPVVLDTNKWYHKTLIVGNEISITIGSEFD